MHEFFQWRDAGPALGFTILFLSAAVVVLGWKISTEWRKRHLGAMRNDLTRAMVEAGMSADDIVRVLHAATEADEVVRVLQAAKGAPEHANTAGNRRHEAYNKLQMADARR